VPSRDGFGLRQTTARTYWPFPVARRLRRSWRVAGEWHVICGSGIVLVTDMTKIDDVTCEEAYDQSNNTESDMKI
jgi:hypothetical protein